MAYTTINKSGLYFAPKAYTGNASTQAITGVGFQPDWLWIKNRSTTNAHNIFDAVRGTNKKLDSAETTAENASATNLTSFDSDGFTLASNAGTNGSGNNIISWNWKAGTTSGINQDGASITPTAYSFNQTAGFSIITYTGTGSVATLPHGLGVTPNLILIKKRSGADNWTWKSDGGVSGYTGFTKYMYMNNSAVGVATDSSNEFQYNPTATKFSLGTNGGVNGNGATYVAYCFANKVGYQKIGGYVGNGNSDGYFLPLGFKPKFIMTHRLDSGDAWTMLDFVRDHDNGVAHRLFPHQNNAENTSIDVCDFVSNGVKFRTSDGAFNDTGGVYVYWAIGQSLVGSNNIPCTAR
tara:strand:+ start:1394 stop:2446 length:1053 start_codon:yes stop_codon:yes gene_type:complete